MIRALVAICFAASGALAGITFGSRQRTLEIEQKKAAPAAAILENILYLAPDIFTASVIGEKDQLSFAIFRFAFESDLAVKNETGVDDEVILADALNSVTFNSELYRPHNGSTPDISTYADKMVAMANHATGGNRFKRAMILQYDLFSRTDVRKRVVEERLLSTDEPEKKSKVAH